MSKNKLPCKNTADVSPPENCPILGVDIDKRLQDVEDKLEFIIASFLSINGALDAHMNREEGEFSNIVSRMDQLLKLMEVEVG